MYKIAAIGERDCIPLFRAFGIETIVTDNSAEAWSEIKTLAEQDYAIIFLTEQLAAGLTHELSLFAEKTTPAIILIPGREGTQNIAMSAIDNAVERAVGANILAD